MRACAVCGQAVPLKWRNDGPAPVLEHEAGPIVDVIVPRRSCPGYIETRFQECARCGKLLVRGRWALFFVECQVVYEVGDRAPILTPAYRAEPDARRCDMVGPPAQRTWRTRYQDTGYLAGLKDSGLQADKITNTK